MPHSFRQNGRRTFLRRLTLTNFRRFREIDVEFDEVLTVFVAPNGGGKTALLDAAAVALSDLVDTLRGVQAHGFSKTDIRLTRTAEGQTVQQPPVALDAAGQVDGRDLEWRRELATEGGRTTSKDATPLRQAATTLLGELQDYADQRSPTPPSLPVIAYYGTGRLWDTGRLTKNKEKIATRFDHQLDAYVNCLKPSSTYGDFSAWFEAVIREQQNESATGSPSPHQPGDLVDAVRLATNTILRPSGWYHIDWDFLANDIVANHPTHGRMSVSILSDGIRNLIALVADLAHRAVRLNPHFGKEAPALTPGIVLIDEVGMHLHPGWQQGILASLQETFQLVQFIVTTHSPQLLSAVDSKCIRIVEETPNGWGARTPPEQTRGVVSSDVLVSVMGVNPVPNVPESQKLSRYRAFIEDGHAKDEEAQRLHKELVNFYGAQHPTMRDCERLIRFAALKQKKMNE